MRALTLFAAVAVVGLFAPSARAEEKPDYAKLLVGKWEVTKADKGTVPVGSAIEFTKDGKMKITADGATIDGTYTVTKTGFDFALKVGDNEKKQAITVTKINDKEMSAKDEDGKVVELKKK